MYESLASAKGTDSVKKNTPVRLMKVAIRITPLFLLVASLEQLLSLFATEFSGLL